MNKAYIEYLKTAIHGMETVRDVVESIRDNQQETMDNMSERAQESERYERMGLYGGCTQ